MTAFNEEVVCPDCFCSSFDTIFVCDGCMSLHCANCDTDIEVLTGPEGTEIRKVSRVPSSTKVYLVYWYDAEGNTDFDDRVYSTYTEASIRASHLEKNADGMTSIEIVPLEVE